MPEGSDGDQAIWNVSFSEQSLVVIGPYEEKEIGKIIAKRYARAAHERDRREGQGRAKGGGRARDARAGVGRIRTCAPDHLTQVGHERPLHGKHMQEIQTPNLI